MPRIELADRSRHYYRLEGRAGLPALVLAHPIGADHCIWDLVVPALTSHFQVLRYDLRGHGGTDCPAGDCDLPRLADDLLALASAVGLSRFCLAGVSLGGMVAMAAAAAAPESVDALLVCSTAARLAPPPGGWDRRARSALEGGMASLAPGMKARMFAPAYRDSEPSFMATLGHVFTRTDPAGYAACCAILRDADVGNALPTIRARSLVVSGQRDPLIDPPTAQALAAALANGKHLALDCGHYPMVELPERFGDAALHFFNA